MERAHTREKRRREAKITPNETDKTFVCFVDLKLAFDKVDRDILIQEMIRLQLPIELITLVAKILMNTSFETDGGTKTNVGVQQGSVLGPTLFNIYINSLLIDLEPFTVSRHCFADDICIVCYSQDQLTKAINTINKWCDKMKMQVNAAKSGILAIRNDLRTRQIKKKHFQGIPVLTKYTYLGIEI